MEAWTEVIDVFPSEPEQFGDDEHGVIIASPSEDRPSERLVDKLLGRRP